MSWFLIGKCLEAMVAIPFFPLSLRKVGFSMIPVDCLSCNYLEIVSFFLRNLLLIMFFAFLLVKDLNFLIQFIVVLKCYFVIHVGFVHRCSTLIVWSCHCFSGQLLCAWSLYFGTLIN